MAGRFSYKEVTGVRIPHRVLDGLMDMDLYDEVQAAVQHAHDLHNSLSSLITREWFEPDEPSSHLVRHGEVPTVW